MAKKNSLENKIKKYTALASGLTAVAGGINAQIVYTDVNPDAVVSGNGNLYAVDFNNDAIIDITFNVSISTSSYSSTSYTSNLIRASLPGLGANEGWMGSSSNIQNVVNGAAIGASGAFATGVGILGFMSYYNSSGSTGQSSSGNFLGQEGYVGVKFDIGGSAHYGWVRLVVSADATTFTIKDYAYDATPGMTINAGDSLMIPHPTITQVTTIVCAGDSSASLIAVPNGGIAPFTYSWTDAAMNIVSTNNTLTTVVAGTYILTLTDSALNTVVTPYSITEPMVLNGTSVSTNETLGNDGAINLTVTGGTPPNSFVWSNNATSEDITNLSGGIYSVIVTDSSGCTFALSDTVISTVGIGDNIFEVLNLFPNPTKGIVHIQLGSFTGKIDITLIDITGKILIKETKSNSKNIELDLSSFKQGIYTAIFQTEGNISELKIIKE